MYSHSYFSFLITKKYIKSYVTFKINEIKKKATEDMKKKMHSWVLLDLDYNRK